MADHVTKDMVDKNSNQQLASTTLVMTHVIFEQNASEPNTSTAPIIYETLELPRLSEVEVVKSAVLSVIFLVSLVSNLAILVQLYRKRRRKSTVNLLILHLAIADLFVTFFCVVTEAIWLATIQWYAGNLMCKLVKFLQVFALYLSTYIIVIISIDRCMAILDPLRHNQAARRVRTMIVAAWVASCVLSLPQAYLFRVLRGPFQEDFYQCVTYGAYTEKWQERLYGSLAVLTMYVLPLLAMTTSYLLIILTIARKSNRLKKDTDSDSLESMTRGQVRGKLFRRAKVKSVRMTALIVLAFIVCWTPYDIILIIHLISDIETVEERYITWIFFFGMTNSMVNPLIYGAFNFSGAKKNLQSPTQMRERYRRAHTRATSSDNLLDTTTIARSRMKNKCFTGEEIVMETLTVAYTEPTHRNNRDGVTPTTAPPQPTIDILLSSSDQD